MGLPQESKQSSLWTLRFHQPQQEEDVTEGAEVNVRRDPNVERHRSPIQPQQPHQPLK